MYSNLNLYYLNLMGIKPWLNKNNLNPNKTNIEVKLLILTSSNLSIKEKTLLQQIIHFLALENEHYKHVELQNGILSDERALESKCILILGDDSELNHSVIKTCITTKVFFKSNSLNELINNPLLKKKLFKLLVSLKEGLTS